MELRVRVRSGRPPSLPTETDLSTTTTTMMNHKQHEGKAEEDDEEQPLSPAARLFTQPSFCCHILIIIGVGKPLDVSAIRSGLELTLARHPRFSSIVVEDEEGASPPRWVRTKVSVEDHIVVPELDETGGEAPEDFVERYASSLIGKPLDKSKPLWEAHLLNVKTREAESTVVIRIHHSLGDGISLMSLFLACTRKASNPLSLPTVPESRPRVSERKPGFVSFLVGLWVFLQVLWYTLVDILVFVATILFYKDSDSLIKGSKGVEFRTKRVVHKTLSLDDIKLIKKVMSATVNDVMIGITSAGLRQYLTRRYEKENSAKEGEKSRILANLRIRSSVLFNTRQTPGLHELSEMMKKGKNKLRWGNQLGYVIIPFSMNRKAHPLDYIREAKAIAGRKKLSLEAPFTYASGLLIAKIFGFKIATALCHRVLSNTTFSFSNVVGALEDVEFFGHPIMYLAPTVYGHPHALTIHFQSYVNQVKLVVSADEEAIPDPHQLCSDIAEALSLIRDSINKT